MSRLTAPVPGLDAPGAGRGQRALGRWLVFLATVFWGTTATRARADRGRAAPRDRRGRALRLACVPTALRAPTRASGPAADPGARPLRRRGGPGELLLLDL